METAKEATIITLLTASIIATAGAFVLGIILAGAFLALKMLEWGIV